MPDNSINSVQVANKYTRDIQREKTRNNWLIAITLGVIALIFLFFTGFIPNGEPTCEIPAVNCFLAYLIGESYVG